MIRTVISLDEESKEWLDQQARAENVSTAEIIRTAVRKYRDEKKRALDVTPVEERLKDAEIFIDSGFAHFFHAAQFELFNCRRRDSSKRSISAEFFLDGLQ